jgi:hypothetical protein
MRTGTGRAVPPLFSHATRYFSFTYPRRHFASSLLPSILALSCPIAVVFSTASFSTRQLNNFSIHTRCFRITTLATMANTPCVFFGQYSTFRTHTEQVTTQTYLMPAL